MFKIFIFSVSYEHLLRDMSSKPPHTSIKLSLIAHNLFYFIPFQIKKSNINVCINSIKHDMSATIIFMFILLLNSILVLINSKNDPIDTKNNINLL